jgi:hypothetical protein
MDSDAYVIGGGNLPKLGGPPSSRFVLKGCRRAVGAVVVGVRVRVRGV